METSASDTSNSSAAPPRRISLAELLIYQFGYDWQKLVNKPECRDLLAERDTREELKSAKTDLNKLIDAAKNAAQSVDDARQAEEKALNLQ